MDKKSEEKIITIKTKNNQDINVKVLKKRKTIKCKFEIEEYNYIGEYCSIATNYQKRLESYVENLIFPSELLDLIENDKNTIPCQIRKGILKLLELKNYNHPIIWALLLDYKKYLSNIINLLKRAANNINCSINQVISKTDYSPNDTRRDRIQEMFLELRTVIVLKELYNFKNIDLIKKSNQKSADMVAEIEDVKYVIEVTRLNSNRKSIKFENINKIVNIINEKYVDKKPQLLMARNSQNAKKLMISIEFPFRTGLSAINYHDQFCLEVKKIHQLTNFYKECDLLLFIGDEHCLSREYK